MENEDDVCIGEFVSMQYAMRFNTAWIEAWNKIRLIAHVDVTRR